MVELLVTPKSITHMETLIDKGADAFVIGEQIWFKTAGRI